MNLPHHRGRSSRAIVIVCGLLLVIFAVISYSAVLTKNASIDEPGHCLSGWLALRHGDFRLETVNPSLWKCWASLGNLFSNPPIRHNSPIWNDRTWNPDAEVIWAGQTLFQQPGFDGDAFVQRARSMMLLLGILLGVMIAYCSCKLAGPVAAIVATSVYCFDPNFIAHAPLVKSDVAFALVLFSFAYAVWRLGQKASIYRVLLTGLLCGLAMNIKFSGVLIGPLLAILLLIRALLPASWMVLNRSIDTRPGRVIAAGLIGVFAAICCLVITWGSYGFRYRPAPSPLVQMDMPAIYAKAKLVDCTVRLGHIPTELELQTIPISGFSRFIRWTDQRHLLPQAMLAGFLYQHTCVQLWPAFLNGELYGNGRWSYFPLAMLYKTPVAELAAIALAACVLVLSLVSVIRGHYVEHKTDLLDWPWTLSCFVIPFAVFSAAAVTTHLNIGVRNVLALYPFMQVGVGCAAAISWQRRPRITTFCLATLGVILACETLGAWPDYIAFFNFPTGGERGGIARLSDSNLDWGQDLKSLADWQRQHPQLPLYANLFDSLDPAFYGLKYHQITIPKDGPFAGKPTADVPITSGYLAVSATHLQGLYLKAWEKPFYQQLTRTPPVAVIHGTIYIYDLSRIGSNS